MNRQSITKAEAAAQLHLLAFDLATLYQKYLDIPNSDIEQDPSYCDLVKFEEKMFAEVRKQIQLTLAGDK